MEKESIKAERAKAEEFISEQLLHLFLRFGKSAFHRSDRHIHYFRNIPFPKFRKELEQERGA